MARTEEPVKTHQDCPKAVEKTLYLVCLFFPHEWFPGLDTSMH